jgi:hypothetical protein
MHPMEKNNKQNTFKTEVFIAVVSINSSVKASDEYESAGKK